MSGLQPPRQLCPQPLPGQRAPPGVLGALPSGFWGWDSISTNETAPRARECPNPAPASSALCGPSQWPEDVKAPGFLHCGY